MPIIKNNNEILSIPNTGSCIVDYYAEWCGPCKMISPILDNIGSSNDVTVIKVNIDDYPNLAKKDNIATIPTLLFYKDGKFTTKLKGAQPESVIRSKL